VKAMRLLSYECVFIHFLAYHRGGRGGCQGKKILFPREGFFLAGAGKSWAMTGNGRILGAVTKQQMSLIFLLRLLVPLRAFQMTTLFCYNGLMLSCRTVLE
jgi:hypothetical protein